MLVYTVIACTLALALNLATVALSMNYMTSVVLVMVGVSAVILLQGVKSLSSRDYASMSVFVLGSAVATTIIEKLMIVFDVWGFSNRHAGLCGLDFWGAPIEEYIYWWLAPLVVCVTYVVAVRDKKALSSFEVPAFLSVAASTMSLKAVSEAMTKVADASSAAYLESNGPSQKRHRRRGTSVVRSSQFGSGLLPLSWLR
jgi:lycopene cyclase domain-containing protein